MYIQTEGLLDEKVLYYVCGKERGEASSSKEISSSWHLSGLIQQPIIFSGLLVAVGTKCAFGFTTCHSVVNWRTFVTANM